MEIQDSVELILQHGEDVADRFYATFLDRFPEARAFFDGVDLKRQAVLLTMTLKLLEEYHTHGFPAIVSYLKYLGHRHRVHLKIPVELYPPFGECLMEALRDFHGAKWDANLERQWRTAIEGGVAVMIEDYWDPQVRHV